MAKRAKRVPVVMHFQPRKFTKFGSAAKLKEWENLLTRRVGMKRAVAHSLLESVIASGGTCCESGDTNDCDID